MTNSYSTYWCPACDRVGACKNKWAHEQTKMHRRNTERKFPRPDRPVDLFTLKPIIPEISLPRLIYLIPSI